MKISEFYRPSAEFGKRAEEIHTTKQKLMYGSEINVGAKSPEKRNPKKSISDMLKYAVASVASVAVIAVSVPTVKPVETPPVVDEPTYKYQYEISYPTYTQRISSGGYAVCLDISTEEKRQAYYKVFADLLYENFKFSEERGDEYMNDPNPLKSLITFYNSETPFYGSNKRMGSIGRNFSFDGYRFYDGCIGAICALPLSADTLNILRDYHKDPSNTGYINRSNYWGYRVENQEISDIQALYGGKTREEVLEAVTETLDRYLYECDPNAEFPLSNECGWNEEAQFTCEQYTVEGECDLVLPIFTKIVRDDELYGYKTLTVPANTPCLVLTGRNDYPLDKQWDSQVDIRVSGSDDVSYNVMHFTCSGEDGHSYMYSSESETKYNSYYLSNKVFRKKVEELSGTAPIYYDPLGVNFYENVELSVPQMTRILPITDDYHIFKLGYGSSTYTVTNDGDHEVAVMGNWYERKYDNDHSLQREYLCPRTELKFSGNIDQDFNFRTLLPGESFSFTATGGAGEYSSLAMPQCCTVTDSSGTSYTASNYKADLIRTEE